MDRLKSKLSKILLTVDLIADEKTSIQENLNLVTDQVLTKAYYLKANAENIKHKNVSQVQKYILEIYQHFCEMNSALDVLLEENPLTSLDVSCANNDFDCTTKYKNEPADRSIYQISFTPEPPGSTETELEENDKDIQNLKKSLSEFSEKLGLNKQGLSNIKDYYEKASNAFHIDSPESILVPSSSFSQTGQHSKRHREVPEKDTNTESKRSWELACTDLTKHIRLKGEQSDNASPSFSIPDSDKDAVTQKQPRRLHTALEKLNNCKLKATEIPESTISPDIKLKPPGAVIHNFIQHVQEKPKKDCKKHNNIHYDIPLKDTPKAGEEECLIIHIESPDEFYIHVVDTITISIDEFSTEINNYCRRVELVNYASKEEALAQVGKFCLALIEQDETWHRVEILQSKENENVLVRLVDYGQKKLVSYKNLLRLTEELSSVPMLAIRCHFPWLYPPGSTFSHKLTTWPSSTIEAMNSICDPIKIVYAHREENNSVAIDFSCEDIEDTIGQILLDKGFAVQLEDDVDENNAELGTFLYDVDTVEADNINEAVLGYDPRDEARICRFTKPDGTCYKGKNCKLEHIPLPKDGFTTDKEAVFSEAMYPLILPPNNSTVMILITSYIDTCRFFGQIIQKPHNQGKYTIDHELYILLKEMNSPNIVKTYELYKMSPALGEIVIVKHFRKWLRAIIRGVRTDEAGKAIETELFILDWGENITALIEEVRKIKPQFLKLPFQAVEFYIYNYQMKKNCSAQNAKQFFMKNLYLHNFIGTTMSSYPPLKIDLKNLNGCMLVGPTLEQEGYAERRIMDMHVSESCILDLC